MYTISYSRKFFNPKLTVDGANHSIRQISQNGYGEAGVSGDMRGVERLRKIDGSVLRPERIINHLARSTSAGPAKLNERSPGSNKTPIVKYLYGAI